MRHKNARLQLNRFTSWRKATLRSLARNLLIHQSIMTSRQKAKAVKPIAERIISLAKQNTLEAKRRVFSILGDHRLVSLVFNEIGPRFLKRESGFTRTINFDSRRGDNAQLVILELTELKKEQKKRPAKETEITKGGQPPEAKKPEVAGGMEKTKPPITKKPSKKFFGGLRKIFKKERDSL